MRKTKTKPTPEADPAEAEAPSETQNRGANPLPLSTLDTGEKTLMLVRVREAFSDIGPHNPPLPPFIYWDPAISYSCAAKLIARSPQLTLMAAAYDRPHDLAKKWATVVRTQANNERSTQIRVIKHVWMNNESTVSFSEVDLISEPRTIKLSEALTEEGFEDITDLRKLLFSDKMYLNQTVYDFFCEGLESGQFKNTVSHDKATISDLITPAHEAHFRAELYFALPVPEFRHPITKAHGLRRLKLWQKFLPLVKKDRADNESNATAIRANLPAEALKVEQTINENSLDNPDSQYW